MTLMPADRDLSSEVSVDALRESLEASVRRPDVAVLDRCQSVQDVERQVLDLAARAEDGRSDTLSLGAFLAAVTHWQNLCRRYGLKESVESAREIARDSVAEAGLDWRERVAARMTDAAPAELFRDLLQTIHLRSDAHARDYASEKTTQPVGDLIASLRTEIQNRVAEAPPSDAILNEWTRSIIDQCESTLTAIDDQSPEKAAAQLAFVTELTDWYLKKVETRRTSLRKMLKRRQQRLKAELQERRLQEQIESRFGRRFTTGLERVVLLLICVVLGLMVVEWTVTLSPETLFWFSVIDGAACLVFLTEFFLKLWLVEKRVSWFTRHVLIDFVPSIPIGLLTAGLANEADLLRAGRAIRFARLPRFARYVRVLRPAIRIARALGLAARGLDRLVRQYRHLLNWNVILAPTSREQLAWERQAQHDERDLHRLTGDIRDAWQILLAEGGPELRSQVAGLRLTILRECVSERAICFDATTRSSSETRDIPAERLLDRLESVEPDTIEPLLGESIVNQLARVIRTLSIAPFRWLPLVRRCVPTNAAAKSNVVVVAEASQKTAAFLRTIHDGWFWFADLYGTVTPSQFVDRIGGILVKSSFRPAYRLALFGGILLLVEIVLRIVTIDALAPLRGFLKNFVGTTVMMLGGVCFVVLGLGWWLQRVAREATEFYEKAVNAQFLLLTESIRPRYLERDAEILFDRVLQPDWPDSDQQSREERVVGLSQRFRDSLLRTTIADHDATLFPFVDRLVLLYRDWLDGAMFTTSDTRATDQLLGNTALRQLVLTSRRITKAVQKSISQVDLENQKSLTGPYIWFHFISQSMAHSVARLLVDYNRQAIPLHELDHCGPEQRRVYARWLDAEAEAEPASDAVTAGADEAIYVTTAFTALHFLDADPAREAEVEVRFGSGVVERMRRDRALLVRRTFGTLPLHTRPRSERVVNLYSLYKSWIAGGRLFLFPLFVLVAAFKGLGRGIAWLYRAVQEIRNPERRTVRLDAAQADFRVAARKIRRIRGPVAERCARLRAMLDPAWLGTPLPGEEGTRLVGVDAETDLEFLQVGPALEREIEDERRLSRDNMRRLDAAIADGLLSRMAEQLGLAPSTFQTRNHLRVAGVSVHGDLYGIRSHLFARSIIDDVFRQTTLTPRLRETLSPRVKLRTTFRKYWKAHCAGQSISKRAAWSAVLSNENGVADALVAWSQHGESVTQHGEQLLGRLLLHPGRVTEQLLTLRAVQTLTVLDVLHYREQVLELGQYEIDAESFPLSWLSLSPKAL